MSYIPELGAIAFVDHITGQVVMSNGYQQWCSPQMYPASPATAIGNVSLCQVGGQRYAVVDVHHAPSQQCVPTRTPPPPSVCATGPGGFGGYGVNGKFHGLRADEKRITTGTTGRSDHTSRSDRTSRCVAVSGSDRYGDFGTFVPDGTKFKSKTTVEDSIEFVDGHTLSRTRVKTIESDNPALYDGKESHYEMRGESHRARDGATGREVTVSSKSAVVAASSGPTHFLGMKITYGDDYIFWKDVRTELGRGYRLYTTSKVIDRLIAVTAKGKEIVIW